MKREIKQKGFTLLELSIVIVITSLLLTGLYVGSDLVRMARVNTVAADLNEYKNATFIFYQKYGSLPLSNGGLSEAKVRLLPPRP